MTDPVQAAAGAAAAAPAAPSVPARFGAQSAPVSPSLSSSEEPTPAEQLALDLPERPFRLVGEVLDSYLIVEQGETVLFIDKHAAHERILFEKLKSEDHPILAQQLLSPLPAGLSREEAAIVLENADLLNKCGFEVSDFGDSDLFIRQIPSDVAEEDARVLLQELAEALLSGRTLDPAALRDTLLHTIACKAAIKAGWHTERAEAEHLVREVLTRSDVKYCPHGRPVCIELTKHQLERQFKRV